jgi:hypothetical protein
MVAKDGPPENARPGVWEYDDVKWWPESEFRNEYIPVALHDNSQ